MKKLAVFDFETDPFLHGRVPQPFSVGFYNKDFYHDIWGDNVLAAFVAFLESLEEPHLIYAHNGGKFDFWFLHYAGVLENPIKIINGRIVSCKVGIHELRDSFALMPFALAMYKKDNFDYTKMERKVREKNKKEILHYLKHDCVYLYELVEKFIARFGLNLTIGGTAIKALQEYHPFERCGRAHDEKYRPFYFGGRVQFFESGILKGNFKIYDVNSMYPYVMSELRHPTGDKTLVTDENLLDKKGYLKGYDKKHPYFIIWEGYSDGAMPLRYNDGLNFPQINGVFHCTSHELQVALKHNLIQIDYVHELRIPQDTINFKLFVKHFIKEKIQQKQLGNKAETLFAKLILNSSYGKFGQNPDNFYDYKIRRAGEELPQPNVFDLTDDADPWDIHINHPQFEIWKRPSPNKTYFNVATAASITGAARAVLLDAIAKAKRPVYCDTDSIICEALPNVTHDTFELGAWDCEAVGHTLAIGGKKMYALFSGNRLQKRDCVKTATKGARLEPHDIVKVAQGTPVTWKSYSPNFKLSGDIKFIERIIRKRT